ncbi:MAG: segregation/condensation protein A [Verrucomicrobiota bacterium]
MTDLPQQDPMRVALQVFEGPLDLLLYLIKKEEVDIYEVEMEKIADQYLAMLDEMESLDLEVAGDFLVVAAQLIYIKSRTLLPVDQQMPEEEDNEDDPRWELIRQLVEYKKFKEAAEDLEDKAEERSRLYFHQVEGIKSAALSPQGPGKIEMIDLVKAFQKVLQAAEERYGFKEIHEDRFTVSEKIEGLIEKLKTESVFSFHSLFHDLASRGEIVVTFLAVLELIRLKRLKAIQNEAFGGISLERVENEG